MAQKQEDPSELKLNFEGLKEALTESQKEMAKTIMEALKPTEPQGKGFVMPTAESGKLIEALKTAPESGSNWKLTEQWTVVIPNYRTAELKANLRDYVYTSEILKNEPGDVANIPYVTDAMDFEQLGAVGNAFAATWAEASIMGSLTTTLYEAGGYADLSYYLIERFNQNLLEEINNVLASAAVRSEDAKIMALVEAITSTSFAGNVTRYTGSANFYSSNIPKALNLLLNSGKAAKPQDCVLYLTPHAYSALLEEMMTSQPFAYAVPSLLQQGVVEKLIGVGIVVGGYRPSQQRTNANTGTVDLCYLMRGKRAVALAPKRELLIETQKQIGQRKLRMSASHTFGIKILDAKEIVRIWTARVA
jgi:HK97 family phage major capsid protein